MIVENSGELMKGGTFFWNYIYIKSFVMNPWKVIQDNNFKKKTMSDLDHSSVVWPKVAVVAILTIPPIRLTYEHRNLKVNMVSRY